MLAQLCNEGWRHIKHVAQIIQAFTLNFPFRNIAAYRILLEEIMAEPFAGVINP
jgi:hypothetical protein